MNSAEFLLYVLAEFRLAVTINAKMEIIVSMSSTG